MYGNRTSARPSRFISDIDDKYCDKRTQSEPTFKVNRSEKPWQNRYQQGSYGQRNSYGNNYNSNRYESSRPVIVPKQMKRIIPTPNTSAPAINVNSDAIEYGNQKIYVGTHVMHDTFGMGEVKGIDGVGASTKLTIEFRNVGTKHLLLKFARLKVVE
jgi:DNA helicase-2/ATP-dependent DNA helicase PcrA